MLNDLNVDELKFLAVCMKKYSENKRVYSKALTTKDPKQAWEQFKKLEFNDLPIKRHIKVSLSEEKEVLFTKAFDTDFVKSVTPKNYETLTTIISDIIVDSAKYENVETPTDYKVISKTKVRPETFDFYKQFFTAFNSYGSNLIAIYVAETSNGINNKVVLECNFVHKNQYLFALQFPFINKDFMIENTNSKYMFNLIPKNLDNYLNGIDNELELQHPYEYFCKKALEYKFDSEHKRTIFMKQEYFDIAIEREIPNVKGFQKRIDLCLRSAKENYNDSIEDTPIIWLDKCKSKTSIEMNKNVIFMNLDCNTINKYKRVKGIDLFTGSTSTPAIRCRIASNYKIVKESNKIILKKVRDFGAEFDYVSDFKKYNIGMFKTSSKRANCSTIKDTYVLTNPIGYVKRVSIK